jgi:hypothetical protein
MPSSNTPRAAAPRLDDAEQAERAEAFQGTLPSVDNKALGVALATGAFALTARPAYGQDMPSVPDVLRFALTLEYLEREFYEMGISSGVIADNASGEYDAVGKYTEIRNNEQAHVQVLKGALNDMNENVPDQPDFDFTGGNGDGDGPFDPFNNYAQFLVLSQAFEDTGVRAYKGGAPALINSDAVLTVALQIHSVEARHAAVVRRLVENNDLAPDQEAWIERNGRNRPMPGGTDPAQAVYAGMDQTTKYDIDVEANSDVNAVEITESFDEALGMTAVLDIADPFIPGDQGRSS